MHNKKEVTKYYDEIFRLPNDCYNAKTNSYTRNIIKNLSSNEAILKIVDKKNIDMEDIQNLLLSDCGCRKCFIFPDHNCECDIFSSTYKEMGKIAQRKVFKKIFYFSAALQPHSSLSQGQNCLREILLKWTKQWLETLDDWELFNMTETERKDRGLQNYEIMIDFTDCGLCSHFFRLCGQKCSRSQLECLFENKFFNAPRMIENDELHIAQIIENHVNN